MRIQHFVGRDGYFYWLVINGKIRILVNHDGTWMVLD